MSTIREKDFRYELTEDEPPPKKLVSDADLFIKQLAEKQRNTSISLQEQLNNPKEFTKETELIPLAKYNPGTSSLDHFRETAKHFEQVETLKAAGLEEQDIELYFDSLKGFDYVLQKHKNWERTLLKERLDDILEIIRKHEEKKCSISKITAEKSQKYNVEYGLTVKPDSTETKLLKFALDNQKDRNKSKAILPHPMNNIKQIQEERFAQINVSRLPSIKQIRRKARKLLNRINSISDIPQNAKSVPNNSLAAESKWDVMQKVETKPKCVEKKTYTCLPQNYYTIKNGEIIKLNKNQMETRGLEVAQKLSVEEIKMLPKFQNYEPGSPSKVLYLKNLQNNIKEDDLRHLFKNYDKNGDVTYNIMKGKMRGQAFVTFQDEAIASRALDDINGTILRNKPVIIEFGNLKN